jgi:hypothetical protein
LAKGCPAQTDKCYGNNADPDQAIYGKFAFHNILWIKVPEQNAGTFVSQHPRKMAVRFASTAAFEGWRQTFSNQIPSREWTLALNFPL